MTTNTQIDSIRDLIKYIVQALVDSPEQVEVSEIEGTRTSIIEVRVAKREYGQVIGKQGRNANAIRTILRAASAKDKKRSVLEIVEQKHGIDWRKVDSEGNEQDPD